MGRRPAAEDTSAMEIIDFVNRTISIPNTTLPPFKLPKSEMSTADFYAFVRKARGAAAMFAAEEPAAVEKAAE